MAKDKRPSNESNALGNDAVPDGEAGVGGADPALSAIYLENFKISDNVEDLALYIEAGGEMSDQLRRVVADKLRNPKRKRGRPTDRLKSKDLLDSVFIKKMASRIHHKTALSDRAALKQIIDEQDPKKKLTEYEIEHKKLPALQKKLMSAKKKYMDPIYRRAWKK